jgi:hypothetical protein
MLLRAKSFAFGVALLIPVLGFADRTFTYTANDYKAITATEPGPISIPVRTIVIIQASGEPVPQVTGPTRTFRFNIQPPESRDPRIIAAFIDNLLLDIRITGTNADGEYQATVELPLRFGLNPSIKVDWGTQNAGVLETTAEGTCDDTTPAIHAVIAPKKHAAARKPTI